MPTAQATTCRLPLARWGDMEPVRCFGKNAGRGKTSELAAIVQLCADDEKCYVFVLHAWSDCRPSFRDFMGDANIRKASIGAKTDDGFVIVQAPCLPILREAGCIVVACAVSICENLAYEVDHHAQGVRFCPRFCVLVAYAHRSSASSRDGRWTLVARLPSKPTGSSLNTRMLGNSEKDDH